MRICVGCEAKFSPKRKEQKYCSHPCSNKSKQKYVECNGCGDLFRGESRRKYCSRSCSARVNNSISPKRKAAPKPEPGKSRLQMWLDGEWSGTTAEGLSSTIRRHLLEEAGYRCQSPDCCVPGGWSGVNPKSGKTTLTVDHIDGNAFNNKRENLIVLCPNCHSLTPTYGALNKGNGRKFRYINKDNVMGPVG